MDIAMTRNAEKTFSQAGGGGAADEQLLTIADVAEFLRVDKSWVYQHVRMRSRNRLPALRLGKYWRFRKSDLISWVEQQRVGIGPNA